MKPKLLIILIFLVVLYLFQGIYLPKESGSQTKEPFLISKGEGIRDISSNLEKQGLIKDENLFKLYVFLRGRGGHLQAGEYSLSPSMNINDIAKKIASGDVTEEIITIPEGWDLRDIAWSLENKGMFQAEELFELVGFPLIDYSKNNELPEPKDFDYDFLENQDLSLEGYLFPDTYYLSRGMSLEEIVEKMLDNFDGKLSSSLKEEIERQGKTIFEIINMASLIEKEVRTPEDRELVSGILWKRLENSFPLQVDATVTYITQKQTVSKLDTKIDSPYNTYKYRGLPLGPICNPGLDSIKASLSPKDSQYWYYLSTPEGETIFSRNLEEHNIAKAKYLK